MGSWCPHLLPYRSMARRNIRYPVLRIVKYIRTSYSIFIGGWIMAPLLGNRQSLVMDCKQLESSISNIRDSLDYWKMFLEDLKSMGGVLPWPRNGRKVPRGNGKNPS
jgi:hypothetical protein